MHRIESYESTTSAVSASSSEILNIQQSKDLFENAETVEDLQQLTISFLRGDLSATAYHFGPLMAESQPLVEKLIQLNELGFITTGSQPGGIESDGLGVVEKRFYVEGILKRRHLSLFLQSMYIRCGSTCFIVALERERTYEEIHDLKILDLYSVTRKGRQSLLHISEVTGPCQMFQTCDEVYPQLVDEYVSIYVMDTRWKNESMDILDAMLETLRELQDIPTRIAQRNRYP